ncbi:hypothetical protein ACFRAQ_36005 [Nocardia sp. NPDC056611]|uniref:hypothetical protein n=1 Tax=Nocardia sp. NPDC056611 TaxID=3345877 RepID=UPI00366A594F
MDDITPYHARLFNAVMFGERHARMRANRVVVRLWRSRRFWQTRALGSESELGAIRRRRDTNRDKRVRQASLLDRVWKSRRGWQDEAIESASRLKLIEDLCLAEQAKKRSLVVSIGSDVVLYAADPNFFDKPEGWDDRIALIQRAANRGGSDGASV